MTNKNLNPLTGAFLKENGDLFQAADLVAFMQEYNLTYQTFMNGAAVLSVRVPDLATAQNHAFVLDVPANRKLILVSRILKLTQGQYHIDAIVPDQPLDLGTQDVIVGAAAPLDKERELQAQTRIRVKKNITTPFTVREFDFADTGAGVGAARAQGSTGAEGVFKGLVNQSPLLIRKTVGSDPFTANLTFICWERDRVVES
jgi:hypothetical protein